MIKVEIIKDNTINSICIQGHAKYADYGKDIVCASVSSMLIFAINSIIAIDSNAIIYEEKKDCIKIKNFGENENVNTILNVLNKMLIELENDYPKNIKIREEEI